MINLYTEAKLNTELGNYRQALSIYETLLSESKDFQEKVFLIEKISFLKEKTARSDQSSIGEALFPIYSNKTEKGYVLKATIEEGSGELNLIQLENFNKVKEYVKDTLNRILETHLPELYVFDWGLEKYKLQFSSELDVSNLDGQSSQLAMAVSIISKVLQAAIPIKYAFSASLKKDGHDIKLLEVEKLDVKMATLREEYPKINSLITGSSEREIIKKFNTLLEVVETLWPNLSEILKTKAHTLGNRRVYLEIFDEVKATDGQVHKYAKFTMDNNLEPQEGKEIYNYLYRNHEYFIDNPEGIIIDGLTIIYAAPMLLAMREVTNHISNFIALRKLPNHKANIAHAYVIRTSLGGASTHKPGDIIEYKIPESLEN